MSEADIARQTHEVSTHVITDEGGSTVRARRMHATRGDGRH